MVGKRKEGDDDGRSSDLQPPIKRIRKGAGVSMTLLEQMRICQDIVETLRTHKTEDGRLLAENFLRAPSRRISPEYHKMVSNPMDIMRIQQKLKNEEYDSVDQFVADMKNLSDNAKTYYKKNSQEYKDASELWHMFLEQKARLLDMDDASDCGRSRESSPAQSTRSLRSNSPGRSTRSKDTSPGRSSVSGSDILDKSFMEEYLAGLLRLVDENGRNISLAFRALPTREEYPDYYNVITAPMDLKTVAIKLRKGQYRNLNDMQRDLCLMCRNAKIFNEPKSTIYKDANFLKKAVETRKAEILEMAMQPLDKARAMHAATVVSELIRSPHSVDLMEMDYAPNDLEEDSDEEDVKVSDTRAGRLWRLYWSVRSAKENDEAPSFSEPFCRLPSKKQYPDYYDEIKNPVSLFMINRKIKKGEYERFVELVDDLNLMFNNAKLYNIEGSPIFYAACKLQTIANQISLEIDPTIDISQYNVEVPVETPYGQDGDESEGSLVGSSSGIGTTKKVVRKPRMAKGNMEELMNTFRNKLLAAYNVMIEYKDPSGRWLAEAFMEKPPRKLYPDYYQFIPDPIDFKTIKASIDGDKYDSLGSFISDVELLFSNARHYNEEESQIYNDAIILESVFKNFIEKHGSRGFDSPRIGKEKQGTHKLKSGLIKEYVGRPRSTGSGSAVETPATTPKIPKQKSSVDIIKRRKMWNLYETIYNYTDNKGNKLSPIFSKVPLKADYPDYYEVIKRPIDLQKIHSRLTSKSYETLESLVQDFHLMFDNACKYNDPESAIYKSALTLQKILLEKKAELQDEEMEGKIPDVQTAVQELLTTLFIAVYNHEDEEGRCFSDSLAELPDLLKEAEPNASLVSLDDIKRRLDKGRYRRLDRFQEDVFELFNKARQLSRSDSQLFEDAVELQSYFIQTRNNLCKNGEIFMSPALKFTERDLALLVEEQRKQKQPAEKTEDASSKADDPRLCPSERKEGDAELSSFTINNVTYTKGDFVYIKPNDEKLERHILRVERIFRDEGSRQEFVSGNWFYRPYETFHLATRKFLEKEVFRTEFYDSVDAERLAGKCYVMFVKDYFKYRPKEFDDNDVFVCESKYLGRVKHFKKIKYWHIDMDAEKVKFIERTKPISSARVPSVFASSSTADVLSDQHEDEEEDFSILESTQQEVTVEESAPELTDGNTHYKKINHKGLWLKIGDGAYIDAPGRKPDIIRISQLWKTAQNDAYLKGMLFVRPQDLVGVDPASLFYSKELLATERIETIAMTKVIGKCIILSSNDYSSVRPTEINEPDIFVNESAVRLSLNAYQLDYPYHVAAEGDLFFRFPLPNTPLSPLLDDEYYHFKKPIRIDKEPLQMILKRESIVEQTKSFLGDVSFDFDPTELLKSLHTTPKLGARSKSGYILFSAVVRKRIMSENPAASFGDVSRIVGQEWKKLSDDDKKRYEEEATRIAQARAKVDATPTGKQVLQPGQIRVFCCKWKECDYQFETTDQLYDHITTAHTSQIVVGENQYVCLWLTCAKYRKEGKPFPSLPRLHRHIKDKHLPTSAKCIQPQNKSKHYVPLAAPGSSTPQLSPGSADNSQMSQPPGLGTPVLSQNLPTGTMTQPQIVYYQQNATGQAGSTPVLLDAYGNVLPGQQVLVYQVQQGQTSTSNLVQMPGSTAGTETTRNPQALAQADPGSVIVQAPQKAVEPVFVAPPKQRVQRVMHSDIYLRYIEGLASQQPTNSRWDQSLGTSIRPPPLPTRNLPTHYFHQLPETKEELAQALWNLREHMMKDTLGIKRIIDATNAHLL